jgi:hypothetical protein
MRRQDWLLLAIGSANDHRLSPVQLQKSLFVLGRELPDDVGSSFYEFQPYHYGPFDASIYRDAEYLGQQGLVSVLSGDGLRCYAITDAGQRRADEIRQLAPQRAANYLSAVVNWAQSLSFPRLVRSVYAKYPDTSSNSIFRG